MSIGRHFAEFRHRLMVSVLAILVFATLGFVFADHVLDILRAPVTALQADRLAALNFTTPAGAFDLRMQIALLVGIVVASPVWIYQVWMFLMPAMRKRERLAALGFLAAAIPLFLAGCVAGWWVMPHVVEVLASLAPKEDATLFSAREYYDFAVKLIIAIGVGFVLPVFVVVLNAVGIMSGRTIIHGWRWAVLLIIVFCATVTPSADVMSMFLLAVPMLLLYFGAAAIALVVDRVRARRTARSDAALEHDEAILRAESRLRDEALAAERARQRALQAAAAEAAPVAATTHRPARPENATATIPVTATAPVTSAERSLGAAARSPDSAGVAGEDAPTTSIPAGYRLAPRLAVRGVAGAAAASSSPAVTSNDPAAPSKETP